MNAQLPPTDPMLRGQLARRAAVRLPDTLLAETTARLDAAPQRARKSAPRALRMPRLALAGAALAAALLAVAVALPALRPGPAGQLAGYPAERALTTAELAELMAGPALPANMPLVAAVTIQARTDVCPMNSRPTVGVIEGMHSQVCVMGSDLSARLSTPIVSGTFAFRYMAPGYLGLITEIAPASSRLAFRVSEEWPTDGRAFLVEGYLGATDVPCVIETEAAGDPLSPSGYEQCHWSWLSDDGSSGAMTPLPTWSPAAEPTPARSVDWLALDDKARHVEAGGAREIDSIPAATTRGFFVVKPVTGPCPGAAPFDSSGCSMWRVLAKVPSLTMPGPETPAPSSSPLPSSSPDSPVPPSGLLAPGGKAFTIGQLADAMAADAAHLAGQIVVVDAPLGSGMTCGGSSCAVVKDLRESQGTWAVRIASDGMFEFLGPVEPTADGGLVRTLKDWNNLPDPNAAQPDPSRLLVVSTGLSPAHGCTPLGDLSVLESPRPIESTSGEPSGTEIEGNTVSLQSPYCDLAPPYPSGWANVLALVRYSYAQEAALLAVLVEAPDSSPTPQPEPSATVSTTNALSGLIGEGGRPLTTAEFTNAWVADPAHLAGRVAIVKGPLPTGYMCWDAGAADASAPPGTCHIGVLEGTIAPEGYWAVQVGANGTLAVLGELKMNGTLFVWSVDQVLANKSLEASDLIIVQAALRPRTISCPTLAGRAVECSFFPEMVGTSSGSTASLVAERPAYQPLAGGLKPVSGLFLTRRGSDHPSILAGFELTYLPE